jgi:hypothetical protein
MRGSRSATNGAVAPVKAPLATISERKLKANRENAKKSTGPKTLRGKTYSRSNALKHGLFCRPLRDCEALGEDPQEYEEMLRGLREQYQPIGAAEEIEVERIAVCFWRMRRGWRYENAVNLAARRDFVRRELAEQAEYCKERDKEEQAIVLQLQSAQKEIEDTGEISQELKQRILGLVPEFEALWSTFHLAAQRRVKELDASKMFQKLSPEWQSWVLSMLAVRTAISTFEELSSQRWTNVVEVAVGQHVIPHREILDKLLLYETTFDKAINRALDRLERLQRSGRQLVRPH